MIEYETQVLSEDLQAESDIVATDIYEMELSAQHLPGVKPAERAIALEC